MATYVLVDSLNMFMRAKHSVGGRDIDLKIGMSLHIMFSSLKKAVTKFNADHVVICLEGRSWRKDSYEFYKKNRATIAAQRSPREVEDDELYMEAYSDLIQFLDEKTNCTVIRERNSEADDLIATWCQNHPDDRNVIISSDSDFIQLLDDNVELFNGITNVHYTKDAIYNEKDQKVEFTVTNDGKVKVGKPNENFEAPAEWIDFCLFLKCVRGDKSDNIFSAYPGARMKGSKNKTGITEAFNDRNTGGFNYNNFMLQKWTDHEGEEHRVRDVYETNRHLIDLTDQPDEIKQACYNVIKESRERSRVGQVGFNFMKFCAKWDLQRLSEHATEHAAYLNAVAPEKGLKNAG